MNARQAMKTFHYRLNKLRETIGVTKRNTKKPVRAADCAVWGVAQEKQTGRWKVPP
jgi:hypothetical protein